MGSFDLQLSDAHWHHEPGHSAFGIRKSAIENWSEPPDPPAPCGLRRASVGCYQRGGSWVASTSNFWTRIGAMNPPNLT